MFDKLGNRRYVLPVIGVFVICCVMSIALYPMLNAQPKNVPMAVISIDTGVTSPEGEVNIGKKMAENMSDTAVYGDEEAVIKWTEFKKQSAVDKALEENEYYGALVIPEDFTVQQMAAQTDENLKPEVKVIVNQGKNTMLASVVQSAVTGMLSQQGIESQIDIIHAVASEGGALSSLMGAQMTVMPLFMMSMMAAVLMFLTTREVRIYSGRSKAVCIKILYAAGLSFLISWGTILATAVFGNIDMPVADVMLFFWIASFAAIMLIFGALNIAFPLGVTVLLLTFACGMSSAMIAPEMMPDFWVDWIYPWVPQHYIGEGIREILYMDGSAWNTGIPALVITAAAGVILAVIGEYIPRKIIKE